MTLTMVSFGIGFMVGSFVVLSLVCIHMARKHANTLASKLLRPEAKMR
jgi:hypothetical protein